VIVGKLTRGVDHPLLFLEGSTHDETSIVLAFPDPERRLSLEVVSPGVSRSEF
tara:strand:- start:208 stop:366 length:159 start_codon:yes stop_codon:yes gene_type:complete